MSSLLQKLSADYPDISFEVGGRSCWSPQDNKVFFVNPETERDVWALLHEIGHARLRHNSFFSDIDLLRKEVDAWEEAKTIAKRYSISIDQDHVQDCLDTYRDWIFKRSSCPECGGKGLQQTPSQYICLNCRSGWGVSHSRFCRPYRLTKQKNNPAPL